MSVRALPAAPANSFSHGIMKKEATALAKQLDSSFNVNI